MPGLYLHTGNSLNRMAEGLACLLKENRSENPFEPEIIIVQSRGMQRWVSMRIAEKLGVFSNCRFPFPNTFIHDLFERTLGVKPDNGYSPEHLTFKIMGIIEPMMEDPFFASIKKYISDDKSCLKLVQLSRQIADAFDQYLVFRPDFILGWDSGKRVFAGDPEEKAEEWQAIIWNKITAELGAHAARLREDFFSGLATKKPVGLPRRINIFGISYLPLFHLEIFRAYSSVTDVHLFLLNPCRQFWMDIENEKKIIRKSGKTGETPEALHLETGNTLLASMGKQGSDFLGYLYGMDEIITDEEDSWEMPGKGSVLGLIKKDILELRNGPEPGKYPIDPGDKSIALHSCHSPMREVEVLRDNLLDMFENDPVLKPEEIAVMSPDINMYAPYVEAVFGSVTGSKTYIPFSISDMQQIEKPLNDGFFSLLGLSDLRFRASQLFSILDEPAVRDRFGISDDDIGIIRGWISSTCIRWGIDAANRKDLGLDSTDENTWRTGLDRLLLGYAMPDNIFFRDILTACGIEGDNAQVLGKFLTFTDKAFGYGLKLAEGRSLCAWSELLLSMIDDMLETGNYIQGALSLRAAISNLATEQGYTGKPGIQAVTHLIKTSIMEPAIGRFLTRGVTFCSLLPMRSIPMKVVCLIGMNDDAYPRQNIGAGFNLISRRPRKGDRSLRDDDRYLFLESIISAGERLYISYTGQDIRDNSKRPPSVLVSELLDYIKTNFDILDLTEEEPDKKDKAFEERFITKHRLQGFSPKYFSDSENRLFSYSETDCETAKALSQNPWTSLKPFISSSIKHDPEDFRNISVDTLIEFFDNPVRFFLRRRLGITIRRGIEEIDDRETIVPDGLAKFSIRQQIGDCMIKNIDPLPLLKARGMLPHASAGLALYDELSNQTKELVRVVKGLSGKSSVESAGFEISSGGYTISGSFELYGGNLVFWRPSNIPAKHIIRAWLWHVLFNLWGKGGITQIAGFKKKGNDKVPVVMRFDALSDPESTLNNISELFSNGLALPLHFFPDLSMAYAEGIIKKNNDEVIKGLVGKWTGNEFSPGEKDKDPYYLIYPGEICPIDDNFKKASIGFFDELLKKSGWDK
jgi:exodeoxyribonuclease V gamma subunit